MTARYLLTLSGIILLASCNIEHRSGPVQYESKSIEAEGAESVHVSLRMGAGEMRVTDGAQQLARADFSYTVPSWKPEVRYSKGGSRGTLRVERVRDVHQDPFDHHPVQVVGIGAPVALVGVIVAVLVLAPETMGALQAARRNQLQRAVNIALGSVLATIGLTIPAVLMLGVFRDTPIILGLGQQEMMLLALTLVVSMLTFGGERTNMLQGAVHLVMFLVFLLVLFNP
jgi:hypothetical protein